MAGWAKRAHTLSALVLAGLLPAPANRLRARLTPPLLAPSGSAAARPLGCCHSRRVCGVSLLVGWVVGSNQPINQSVTCKVQGCWIAGCVARLQPVLELHQPSLLACIAAASATLPLLLHRHLALTSASPRDPAAATARLSALALRPLPACFAPGMPRSWHPHLHPPLTPHSGTFSTWAAPTPPTCTTLKAFPSTPRAPSCCPAPG